MDRIRIGNIATITRGVSYKKDQANKEKKQDSIALLRANNIDDFKFNYNDLVFISNSLVSEKQHIKCGDIIISMSSGSKNHVGKVAIAKSDMSCTYGAFCAKITPAHILPDYLFYVLRSGYFRKHIESCSKGTNINNLKREYILDFEIPLPSEQEQQRIVTRIEELFSELDSAVETLQKTKQQLEIYRQAVLKEEFANFKEFTTIRNTASLVTSGSRGWAKYYSASGAAFIRIGNLNRYDISISLDDLQCVKLPDHAEGVRSRLEPLDVLISITADLGSIGFVPYNIGEGYINQHIALVRFKNKKQSRFFAWYLRSDIGQKELLKNKRGAGKLGLGLDDIRDSLIPVVDDTTAIEVVSKIEEKLVLCSNIEETVNQSLQQAEALRQSILRQAFEVE